MVNADGTLDLTTESLSTTAATLVTAAHTNQVKVLMCLQAEDQTNFDQAIANHLSTFVANIMTVVNTYGYDGVDINWEPYPLFTNSATSAAHTNALSAALRTALGSKLLTIAANTGDSVYFGTAYAPFDRVNVMTYGASDVWPGGLFYNSALYCSGADSGFLCLDNVKTIWLDAGVPAQKLGLGLAFYGVKWSGGVLASDPTQGISGPRQVWQTGHAPTGGVNLSGFDYNAILPLVTQQNYTWDNSAMVPYINYLGSNPSTYWYLTYDNPQSIQAKVQYITAQGLGGWIIWYLGGDYVTGNPHPHPLLDAVQAGSAPTVLGALALGRGTVGTLYSASLSAAGAAPLHWALSSGSLPNGLSLSSVGVINGTPTTAGTFTFIVTVGNFAGSASQSFTITIAASAN
jgi:chitinase